MTANPALIADVVAANHILYDHGVVDAFGHVSVRHDKRADRFLLARNMAPGLVSAADIIEYDLDSNPLNAGGRSVYLERFIHGEVYRARPDVIAVVHSHSPSVIPFAASSVPLRPVYHMASFISAAARVFEIRERFGTTDMLVRNVAQGSALAEALGEDAIVLMRGHGFCAVAESLPVVVFRAVYTETNAALQQRAIGLGGTVTYLDEGESMLSEKTNRGVVERPWNLWKERFNKNLW